VVTDPSSVGYGFLGEAQDGIVAAINEVNSQGGICGRKISYEFNNSSWDKGTGQGYIQSYIDNGKVFALVGEPDSEGLAGAIDSGIIQSAGIPVVGTDGMLKDQYHNSWVWPVSASTVSNAHIVAKFAAGQGAKKLGVVYDSHYKFGVEGADAFANQVTRLGGTVVKQPIDGTQSGGYSTDIAAFNGNCNPCDAVLMLLEPAPMEQWMKLEYGNWYKPGGLYGGEPLFDDNVANNCPGCGNAKMRVWTGYLPAIQPFDSRPGVAQYARSLKAVRNGDDPHNEFTEGAYLGTKLFLEACKRLGSKGIKLTRANLASELNSDSFDLGMTDQPLSYAGQSLHQANRSMAMFAENYSGTTFNGWGYQNSGYVADPSPGTDQ
jgi:ABC-type branched-subunit amino acid transport system substrate-binding protein